MLKRGLVVVITGASSGLGRATAHALAAHGAHLVLAARNAAALEDTAAECLARGAGRVITRALDVADEQALPDLAQATAAEFGRVDVWINSAALLACGPFESIPAEAFRIVIEANVIGMANGARAALALFRAQGNGHLINVGSVLGRMPEPWVSPYVASKFAVEGLTLCLQQELAREKHIHVSLLVPWALDTPIYQRAGNFSGRFVRGILPVYTPARGAAAICELIERPQRQAIVGGAAFIALAGFRVSRRLSSFLARVAGRRLQFEAGDEPGGAGALTQAHVVHSVSGGWRAYWRARLFGRSRKRR